MPNETIAYQYIERTPHQEACPLTISIKNEDCLIAAQSIQEKYGSVCVLNMANQVHVGGDYLTLCALAQEESLIKRTNLLDALIRLGGVKQTNNPSNPYQYQLPNCLYLGDADQHAGFGELTCLYSADITVSHVDTTLEHPLDNPFTINIISSSAYNLSNLSETFTRERYLTGTVLKIINQLRTAKAHHQRHLVLGAFGCGAFGNEPNVIAHLYRSAIDELEFVGCFDSIVFAVTQKNPDGNYDAFCHVFNNSLFSMPPKPLFNTLMPAFEVLATHHPMKKMLTPFFKINTPEELVYLASKLIKKEICAIDFKSKNLKKDFLNNLLEQLTQHTESGKEILEHALLTAEIKLYFPNSERFKAEPAFLSELKRLLSWHDTEELVKKFFPEDDCCGSELDSAAYRSCKI